MDRLTNFEEALQDILKEYESLGQELAKLREEGKMKTTKFRELLGRKLVYSMIIENHIYQEGGILYLFLKDKNQRQKLLNILQLLKIWLRK